MSAVEEDDESCLLSWKGSFKSEEIWTWPRPLSSNLQHDQFMTVWIISRFQNSLRGKWITMMALRKDENTNLNFPGNDVQNIVGGSKIWNLTFWLPMTSLLPRSSKVEVSSATVLNCGHQGWHSYNKQWRFCNYQNNNYHLNSYRRLKKMCNI